MHGCMGAVAAMRPRLLRASLLSVWSYRSWIGRLSTASNTAGEPLLHPSMVNWRSHFHFEILCIAATILFCPAEDVSRAAKLTWYNRLSLLRMLQQFKDLARIRLAERQQQCTAAMC